MAGTIIADYIRTDANKLSLNVGNTTFATINASGLYSNTGTQIINISGQVPTSSLTGSISLISGTLANTQIANSSILPQHMYSGAIIGVSTYVNSTRITTPTQATYNAFTFTFTKKRSDTAIIIMGVIPTYGNTNDGDNWMVQMGGIYNYTGIMEAPQGSAAGKIVAVHQARAAGELAAGTVTVNVGWNVATGSANRNVDIINPNTSDNGGDARNQQNGSNFTIFEVMP